MALILEIEHLSGVCFAAQGPESDVPDWPIQPDRAFSALVAAWAARGKDPEERSALAWLETLPPPHIEAAAVAPRSSPTVFVPPNDPRTRLTRNLETVLGVHGRQPRRFPAMGALDRDGGLVTRMVWQDAEDAAPLAALDAVARDTAYVGHSASLTRCRFLAGEADAPGMPARRRVYPGRLDRLEDAFAARRRPPPGDAVTETQPTQHPVESVLGEDWLVLAIETTAGDRRPAAPDLRAAPLLAKLLRDALMAGYGRVGEAPPRWVSGHEADGTPTRAPHMAVLPLANVGWAHSDGALHGFALVPPRGTKPLDDATFRNALAAVAPYDPLTRARLLILSGARLSAGVGEDGASLTLRFGAEPSDLRSLDPTRYLGPATTWATATPLVLERHLNANGPEARRAEIEALVARACVHVGLPAPAVTELEDGSLRPAVLADKHSAINAAPPASASGRAARWLRWRVPDRFASRTLIHAVLQFAEPVRGPVVLGAGRFVGLGLCLPLDPSREPQ